MFMYACVYMYLYTYVSIYASFILCKSRISLGQWFYPKPEFTSLEEPFYSQKFKNIQTKKSKPNPLNFPFQLILDAATFSPPICNLVELHEYVGAPMIYRNIEHLEKTWKVNLAGYFFMFLYINIYISLNFNL